MTTSSLARTLPAALGLLVLAAVPIHAQQEQLPQEQLPPDSVRLMIAEFQEIQQELGAIQTRAIEQSPELKQRQTTIQQTVEAVMKEMHPGLDQSLERLESLRGEMTAAQGEQDMVRMQSLLMEGQQIQQQLQAAEAAALARQDVSQQVEAYRTELIDRMKAVDPETEGLIARLERLAMRIQAAMPQS